MAADATVYHTMNGPSEFHCIGSLKTWDITDHLPEITTPRLLGSGRYDEATPHVVEQIHTRITGSQWELFEESSHMPHVEEPEAFLERVEAFLRTTDQRCLPQVSDTGLGPCRRCSGSCVSRASMRVAPGCGSSVTDPWRFCFKAVAVSEVDGGDMSPARSTLGAGSV
jgi:hypothetical protein